MASLSSSGSSEPFNLLVVGEVGNGKSTLIDNLRDPEASKSPMCGRDPQGVTKTIDLYRCKDPRGRPFNLIDSPGIGDFHITAVALITLLEDFLTSGQLVGGLHGVLVTVPVSECRVRLGAQIVQTIVDMGFVAGDGCDVYGNIMLVGTKVDKADDEEKTSFLHGVHGQKSVKEAFFAKHANPKNGRAVMVHMGDYEPLLEAIRALPAMKLLYRPPERGALANALAERIGVVQQEEAIEELHQLMEEQERELQELMLHHFQQEHERRIQRSKMDLREVRLMRHQEWSRTKREAEVQHMEEELQRLRSRRR